MREKKQTDRPADYLEQFEEDPEVPAIAWVVGPRAAPRDESEIDDISSRRPSEMSDIENFDEDVKSVLDAVRE